MKKLQEAMGSKVPDVVKGQGGFTLVEALILIVVLGLVVAIVIGYMMNPMKDASVNSTVAQIGDNLRTISDAADLVYANTTTKITSLNDLVTGTNPPLKSLPTPPSAGKDSAFAGTYLYTFENNSVTYRGWGDNTVNDAVVYLPGVSTDTCKGINAKYAGLALNAAIPVTVDTTKDLQCWDNSGTNTIVKLLYAN